MGGIFSNDTYNNRVTRDNFEQYTLVKNLLVLLLLIPLIFIIVVTSVYSEKTYTQHDGKELTQSQFETRVDYCVELIFKQLLDMDEANCDTWVLTFEGEGKIVEKIFREEGFFN